MEKRDLKADLDILNGEWGMHESDWFRDNGVVIATHAIERAIEAEALVLELREALNKIAYPVRYLQNEADEKNFSLDGRVATELANSSHWLKSIAKEVLGDE